MRGSDAQFVRACRVLAVVVVAGLIAEAALAGPALTGRRFSGTAVRIVQQSASGGGGQTVQVEAQANIVSRGFGQYATEGGVARIAQSALYTAIQNAAFLGGPFTLTTSRSSPLVYSPSGDTSFEMESHGPSSTWNFWRYYGLNGTGVYRYYGRLYVPGALPGIDWGDGSTSPVVQFPGSPTSTSTPAPGTVIRRWRATFSHTYSDRAPRTVRVATGCCAASTISSGNTVSGGSGTITASYRATTDLAGIPFTRFSHGTGGFFGSSVNRTAYGTNTVTPYVMALSERRSTSFGTTTNLVQLTATAQIQALPFAVPAAGAVGLGILALALVGGGLLLLRRV